MLRPLLSLVAPPACVACRRAPGADGVLCRACRAQLRFLGDPRALCRRCGLPRPCGGRRCPQARMAHDSAWAPVAYEGPAAAVVLALKERGLLPVASLMAAQIVASMPGDMLHGQPRPPLVVPVPADPLRRRLRGLDHAGRLAAAVAVRARLPADALLARGHAGRQAGAGRAERLGSGRLPVRAVAPPPPVVLLVDDVHTTGATLHACAKALKAAGTLDVRAVTWARALP